MRTCISLALATTPSGLGSHCKHVGAPTRLRIGNWLRRKCSAVAGGEGARAKGAVSKGTIFPCACKNAKPIGMWPGRCWWLTLVRGPGMISQGADRGCWPRRGSRAQGAHKEVGVSCLCAHGMSATGDSESGDNAWNKIPRTSAEGARGERVEVCHSKMNGGGCSVARAYTRWP
jgi:hypothetical protein